MVLTARPRSLLSWGFVISRRGEHVADVDAGFWLERGAIRIKGDVYSTRRDSLLRGTFSLHHRDRLLAQARKTSFFTRTMRVQVAERVLELKAESLWRRDFELFDGNARVGNIAATSWLGRQAVMNVPDDLELPVQLFLFWLVIILWRRAKNST